MLRERPPVRRWKTKKVVLWGLGSLFGLFVIGNIILFAVYGGQTYPGTTVAGKQFGSVQHSKATARMRDMDLLPQKLTLLNGQKQHIVATADLGISIDDAAQKDAVQKRHWLPVWNLLQAPEVPLTVRVDQARFDRQLTLLAEANKLAPVDAKIEQRTDGFVLAKAKQGSALDTERSQAAILAVVRAGGNRALLIQRQVRPAVTDESLAAPLRKLQAAQTTSVVYTYNGKKYTATVADIAGWYRQANGTFNLHDASVKAYLTATAKQNNFRITNADQAVAATRQALDSAKPLSFALEAVPYVPPAKTFRYCTAVRGVATGLLPELERKLLSTYADERGWGLGGSVDYVHVAAGCDFTVWLSAAAQMPSFGAICDSMWSCAVGPNVAINYDRWQGASDAWNAANGNLDDYRSMVINHETGHWLGFGHSYCGGAGQAAPVMQQQSIDLQGCVFNPWPSAPEQAQLRSMLGI